MDLTELMNLTEFMDLSFVHKFRIKVKITNLILLQKQGI